MKSLIVVIGTIVVIVLLVSSGVLAGAICVSNVGCLASNDENGITINSNERAEVGVETRP